MNINVPLWLLSSIFILINLFWLIKGLKKSITKESKQTNNKEHTSTCYPDNIKGKCKFRYYIIVYFMDFYIYLKRFLTSEFGNSNNKKFDNKTLNMVNKPFDNDIKNEIPESLNPASTLHKANSSIKENDESTTSKQNPTPIFHIFSVSCP